MAQRFSLVQFTPERPNSFQMNNAELRLLQIQNATVQLLYCLQHAIEYRHGECQRHTFELVRTWIQAFFPLFLHQLEFLEAALPKCAVPTGSTGQVMGPTAQLLEMYMSYI